MAQASITRTTRFFEAGASGHLPAGMVLDTDSSAFTLVRVDGKLGFIETGALSADGARSAGAGGAFAPAADSTATFARGAIDLREFRGAHFEGRLIADLDFHAHLEFLDRMAGQFGLTVLVTSSFRAKGAAVAGAIVPPAQRSNHLVGHAIDMNLKLGSERFDSQRLTRQNLRNLPSGVQSFLGAIRAHSVLRWGGDFVKADPVHIDDNLSRRSPDLWGRKMADAPASL